MDTSLADRDTADAPASDIDQRIVLTGVTWEQYEALVDLFGDDPPGIRMAYLEGTIEIMSPSRRHERVKKMVARVVESYALEHGIPLIGLGSTTFRKKAKERGVEPDECYCFDEEKEFPDVAFEVIVTSGGIDRLAIYAGLGVPEVWLWQRGAFELYRLTPSGYDRRERSQFLPAIDFARLAVLAERQDQTAAIRAFLDELRDR